MSGMYSMPPLTQVLREGERKRKRKERETGTVLGVSCKTGGQKMGEEV